MTDGLEVMWLGSRRVDCLHALFEGEYDPEDVRAQQPAAKSAFVSRTVRDGYGSIYKVSSSSSSSSSSSD